MEQDIGRSKAAGFLEHITKPVEFRVLQAALAHIADEPK
jgi:CheY-like chemotaxis protein